MAQQFFPNAPFAWAFCVGLVLLTCVAAYTDTRKAIIPNRLTVLMLLAGLVANAVRGGWLATEDKPLWVFETGSVWLGIVDGLLFATVGFLVSFALMFLLWVFGTCGGGDVKLLAAVGGWVGFWYFPLVWLVSVLVLFVWMFARFFSGGLTPRKVQKSLAELRGDAKTGKGMKPVKPGTTRATYSVPVAVATAVVLLYLFRVPLQLVPEKPRQPEQQQGVLSYARPLPNLA